MSEPRHGPGSEPYDVIVVLGAAVRPGGRPSQALVRRARRGAELFRAGEGRALLVSGGPGAHPPSEAALMRDIAVEAGVPPERVFLEERSRTTLENAVRSAAIMADQGWRSALLVTDPVHLPRGLLAFRSVGIRARPRAARGSWRGAAPRLWQAVAYEALALPWYIVQIAAGRHRK